MASWACVVRCVWATPVDVGGTLRGVAKRDVSCRGGRTVTVPPSYRSCRLLVSL